MRTGKVCVEDMLFWLSKLRGCGTGGFGKSDSGSSPPHPVLEMLPWKWK